MPRLVNDIWGQNVVKERITKYNIKYKAKYDHLITTKNFASAKLIWSVINFSLPANYYARQSK